MKLKARLIVMMALMVFTSISLSAQKPADLVGTWIGTATLEGEAEPNDLTLVLELKDGKLAGHMSDQFGAFNQNPAEEITLEDATFIFTVKAESPQGQLTIKFTMKVEKDSMEGELEVAEMGAMGTWEATKQK